MSGEVKLSNFLLWQRSFCLLAFLKDTTKDMIDFRKLVLLQAFLGFIFLMSGLVINLLQGILYLLLYYTNRNLYRKINYYLIYTCWSQIVALGEWWSGSSCNLHGSEEDLKQFGKEHCIVVMNHRYDVDWLMCWLVCDKLGMLGNCKCCVKKSLRYVPVIGWGWVFGEFIFLERNWDKDKQTFGAKLDRWIEYTDPCMFLFFAEGTRYTPEKHKASLKFAEDSGLPKLKYHLLPRTKGFNFAVPRLKSKTNAIYNVQLAFPKDTRPTFAEILHGKKFVGDIFIRRIPMSEIPTDSDEATTEFLYRLYQEKDEIMENYLKTSTFPGKRIELKRTVYSLFNLLLWCFFVGVSLMTTIYRLLFCGNPWVVATTIVGVFVVFSMMCLMIGVTKADHGSSYGKSTSPPKQNGVVKRPVTNGGLISHLPYSNNSKHLHKYDVEKEDIS